jgi:hypothetical protein
MHASSPRAWHLGLQRVTLHFAVGTKSDLPVLAAPATGDAHEKEEAQLSVEDLPEPIG